MPLVERQDAPGPEPMREHDNGRVGESDIQVGVLFVEAKNQRILIGLEALNTKLLVSEVGEKAPPSDAAEARAGEVVNLG